MFQKSTPFKSLFVKLLLPQKFELNYFLFFFIISCSAPAIERSSCWVEKSPPERGHSLTPKCDPPVLHLPWGTASCHGVVGHCHCRSLAVVAAATLSLRWRPRLSHLRDSVALRYSAACSKGFQMLPLVRGGGMLWDQGARAVLPLLIRWGPQFKFLVTNPSFSRVGR